MDTPQNTHEAGKNVAMAIIAYIGPLVIVSWLSAKDDAFVKFHIKQALVLFVIEIALWILGAALWQFWMIYQIINLAVLVLAVLGIINASQGKEKNLPIVGDWAKYFNNI